MRHNDDLYEPGMQTNSHSNYANADDIQATRIRNRLEARKTAILDQLRDPNLNPAERSRLETQHKAIKKDIEEIRYDRQLWRMREIERKWF